MNDRKTRGKPNKIDTLPDSIKERLHELLRGGHTQKSILEQVNALIEQAGLADDEKISRSGLNRYATRMEAIGQEVREVREMADVWVARLGTKPTGDVSKLLMEMLRTQAFRMMSKMMDDPDTVMDADMLKDLALGIQRLESAALVTHKRETEIRKAFAQEVADQAEQVAAETGLTKEGVSLLKKQILGIA